MEPKCNGQTCSFEYRVWKIKAKITAITVITVYHRLYTAESPSTNAIFLDDFTNWLSERLTDWNNVVITGDFNIHINNQDNYWKLKTLNTMELLDNMELDKLDFNEKDLDNCVIEYKNKIRKALDKLAPEIECSIVIRHKFPWFTDVINQQKGIVRRWEKIWWKHKLDHQWKALKHGCNKYGKLLKRTKTDKLSDLVTDCGRDANKLYKLVNSITGSNTANPMPPSKSDEVPAEEFADYFMNKIKAIRDTLDGYEKYQPTDDGKIPQIYEFYELTKAEVETIIRSMPTKGCELNPITTKTFKQIQPNIMHMVTKLVNTSLTHGIVAKSWESVIIWLLLKEIELELAYCNYRPVSNLSFMSKIIERCMLKQFNKHCSTYHLLPEYQSAYWENHSCEAAIIKLVNNAQWSMERKKVTALITINLLAALDMVGHDILISVLQTKFGVKGKALVWYKSYLKDRMCKVNVGKKYSTLRELLFLIHKAVVEDPSSIWHTPAQSERSS